MNSKSLLAVVELGGYPDFSRLYAEAGFEPVTVTSVRKALSKLKTRQFAAVVAEFNFQSDFRDRTSSLESLLAVLQQHGPDTVVILLYEPEHRVALDRLLARFPVAHTLSLPVAAAQLQAALP